MEKILGSFRTWVGGNSKLKMATADEVRKGAGFRVSSFADLATKVAALSFFNPTFEMLFRGQSKDYKNDASKSALLPSIFRAPGYFTKAMAKTRFEKLAKAEQKFCELATFKGSTRLKRYRVLQWALIQHYEICPTPFLDVTHSLRVACSFSKMLHDLEDTYLFVLGVPYLSGCITTSGDQGLQAMRLTSVCPPGARRPHFQEGYLVGEYPDVSFEARDRYTKEEWDIARRLICKFVIPPATAFWGSGFDAIPKDSLFPQNDPIEELATQIKNAI